ncbi:MAG: hypothetical protein ABSB49_17845 [Polyangia bacterium]|jgi:hypothetical protein
MRHALMLRVYTNLKRLRQHLPHLHRDQQSLLGFAGMRLGHGLQYR